MATNLQTMVRRQVARVLEKGQRYERFDQLRNRHFWSTHLFAPGQNAFIPVGQYDIFKAIPSQTGQGYPTNVPLSIRETNWLNAGRVPDNQNFVIQEIGVTITRPPPEDPATASANGVFANLPGGVTVRPDSAMHPQDWASIAYGMVLEMQFLTNNVPLGWLADFSQSAGVRSWNGRVAVDSLPPAITTPGDPVNGVPAAAFRRKLEVPILLQHGETMGMRLNVHRPIPMLSGALGGGGWAEVRVDWWALESFTEKS